MENPFLSWKGQADYVDSWWLMSTPYPLAAIIASYLVFVLKLGPKCMRHRQPVNLKDTLVLYNLIQVGFSLFLFVKGVRALLRIGLLTTVCLYDRDEVKKFILYGCYWYLVAKITELMETVFFVLRKKQNQVSFLHVYHHTFTVVMSWLLIKYSRTDNLVFVGTLNSLVHVFMYGYYFLSVFPRMANYLWWKKYLTTLQLIQFLMVLVYYPASMAVSECEISTLITFAVFFNVFLFIYLFLDFYVKCYVKTEKA